MAGVYITGIEMPKDEYSYIEIQIWGDGKVYTREGINLLWGKSAIEIPDHGEWSTRDVPHKETTIITNDGKTNMIGNDGNITGGVE